MIPVARKRILLIEDNPVSAMALADCLPCFELDGATTFREARWKLSHYIDPYSAIILDLRLPDAQGSQLAAALHTAWPNIPILVVTGMSEVDEPSVKIYRAGAEKVLRKPVDPELLRSSLIEVMAAQATRKELAPLKRTIEETRSMLDSSPNLNPKGG